MRNSERLYPTIKFCCRCRHIKSRSEFNKNKSRSDGISSYCGECNRAYQQIWTGSEQDKQSRKKYYNTVKGFLKFSYHRAKSRCENPCNDSYAFYGGRGIEFRFSSLREFRDYVAKELNVDPRGGELHRLDNDGHYEKGNICFLAPDEHRVKHRKLTGVVCQ